MKEVAFRPQGGSGGGDDLLTDAVNGGVGHLGEELLEIGIEELGLVRQNRQRGVVAHGGDRLDGIGRHRRQNAAQLLEGVAEGHLALQQRGRLGA